MTTQLQSALLVDLHPSPTSSSANTSHIHVVKNKVNNFLADNQATNKVTQLYILTSSDKGVSGDVDDLIPGDGPVQKTVVTADDRIGSFYEAKKQLDDLDITEMKLVCDADSEHFWKQVCQFLLTPVHDWSIESVSCSPGGGEGKESEDRQRGVSEPPSRLTTVEQNSENWGDKAEQTQACSAESAPNVRGERETLSDDSVLSQVQRYLQTLPSLLGPPEMDRSELLPGKGAGFVHGFSTRRGGVTVIPTLTAMNLMYTDKKRDSQLVVNENRRRLATVGGFNLQNFHIVKVEHGHRVWVVGEDQPPKFDALITNRRDVTIAAAGADCIPLLFADPVAMVIGAAHAGWKGTVERVAGCVVEAMGQRFGCKPEDIRVAMGPGLRLGCFRVLQEEAKLFTDIHPSCAVDTVQSEVCHRIGTAFPPDGDSDSEVVQQSDARAGRQQAPATGGNTTGPPGDRRVPHRPDVSEATSVDADNSSNTQDKDHKTEGDYTPFSFIQSPRAMFQVQLVPTAQLQPKAPPTKTDPSRRWSLVDLQMTNYHVLLQAGVKAEHIDTRTSHCTKCNPDLYFSYERDGFPFGNQIGFLCMPSSL